MVYISYYFNNLRDHNDLFNNSFNEFLLNFYIFSAVIDLLYNSISRYSDYLSLRSRRDANFNNDFFWNLSGNKLLNLFNNLFDSFSWNLNFNSNLFDDLNFFCLLDYISFDSFFSNWYINCNLFIMD